MFLLFEIYSLENWSSWKSEVSARIRRSRSRTRLRSARVTRKKKDLREGKGRKVCGGNNSLDGYPRSNIRRRKRGREGDEESRNKAEDEKFVGSFENCLALAECCCVSTLSVSNFEAMLSGKLWVLINLPSISSIGVTWTVNSLGRIQVRKKFPLFATFARFTATVSLEILFPNLLSFPRWWIIHIGRAVKRNLTIYMASEPCFS